MVLDARMRRLVAEQMLGFVATVCPDGSPNLSPKGTVAVWDDEHLVFLDIRSPGTMANVASNPAMEINVVDPILRKGYRFKGRAEVVPAGELLERILEHFRAERGTDTERVRCAALLHVEQVAPVTSPAYDTGRSEQEVAARWREHHLHVSEQAGAR